MIFLFANRKNSTHNPLFSPNTRGAHTPRRAFSPSSRHRLPGATGPCCLFCGFSTSPVTTTCGPATPPARPRRPARAARRRLRLVSRACKHALAAGCLLVAIPGPLFSVSSLAMGAHASGRNSAAASPRSCHPCSTHQSHPVIGLCWRAGRARAERARERADVSAIVRPTSRDFARAWRKNTKKPTEPPHPPTFPFQTTASSRRRHTTPPPPKPTTTDSPLLAARKSAAALAAAALVSLGATGDALAAVFSGPAPSVT